MLIRWAGLWLPKRCSDAAVSLAQSFAAALPAAQRAMMRAKYAAYAAEFGDDAAAQNNPLAQHQH
tara:strand:+ start:219 stop:413 length:195 start_codon:yes stop_codon:yes gene_type:complete